MVLCSRPGGGQMFTPLRAAATLPAQDLQRAKAFYRDKLGLSPAVEDAALGLMYELSAGSGFGGVPSSGKPAGTHAKMAVAGEDGEGGGPELPVKGVQVQVL